MGGHRQRNVQEQPAEAGELASDDQPLGLGGDPCAIGVLRSMLARLRRCEDVHHDHFLRQPKYQLAMLGVPDAGVTLSHTRSHAVTATLMAPES